jgi:hypothetical protein
MIGMAKGMIILLTMIIIPKRCFGGCAKHLEGIPYQLGRRSKLVFPFLNELI